ncbi:hypothetical protein D3C81_1119170 [compost metagenome]
MARTELAFHAAQRQYALFRRVAAVFVTLDQQQAVDTSGVEGGFLVLTEHYGQHCAFLAGQLAGQAEQVAVVAGEAAADHVRHHGDDEGRLLDHMQWQLHHFRRAGALAAGALLAAGAVDPFNSIWPDEADRVGVLADDAVRAHPAGFAALRGLHGLVQRMQAVAGDPLGARVAADDVAHGFASSARALS